MRNGTAHEQVTWLLNEFFANVVDRNPLGQNVIGARESFVIRNIVLGKIRKRENQRETSAKFSDVATTVSFANAEDLNRCFFKAESALSRT